MPVHGDSARALAAARLLVIALAGSTLLTTQGAAQSLAGAVSVGDGELPYVVEGAGRPCIVVGMTNYYVRAFPDELKRVLRCAFMSTRAAAPAYAADTTGQYPLPAAVADVEAVRQALGWEKVVVFGHSAHGAIALEYARRYPDRASHAILVGSAPYWGARLSAAAQEFWQADASAERKAAAAARQRQFAAELRDARGSDAFIRGYIANAPTYWYDPDYDAEPLWRGIHINMPYFNSLFASLSSYDVREGAAVTTPVFIALGRYDYAIPYTLWDESSTAFLPAAEVHVFSRSGHTAFLEEAREFAEQLQQWLDSTDAEGKPAPRDPDLMGADAARDGWRAAALNSS